MGLTKTNSRTDSGRNSFYFDQIRQAFNGGWTGSVRMTCCRFRYLILVRFFVRGRQLKPSRQKHSSSLEEQLRKSSPEMEHRKQHLTYAGTLSIVIMLDTHGSDFDSLPRCRPRQTLYQSEL